MYPTIEFHLKLVFSFCGPNLPKNGVLLKTEKITTTTEFCKLQLVLQFQPKLIILFFWTKLAEKGYFGFKYTTEFSIFKFAKMYTNFLFELTILIFWTKFAQKGYFQSKAQKMHTTIECSIFISVQVLNFSLN